MLTPEQIDRLIQQADGLAPKEGSIFRALVKLTEAEVHKQDTELIQQMLEAMTQNASTHGLVHMMEENRQRAIAAARARLEPKP